jgi:MATE family multidrug resistance protein
MAEIRQMIRLAAPLVIAELGWMAMGLVDTAIVGRVGALAIAATGMGSALYYAVAVVASGFLLGLDTLVAQAWGAGDTEDARASLVAGVWLAALLTPIVMGLVWLFEPILGMVGIDPSILREAGPFLHAMNWGTPPLMLYFVLRRYLQAVGAENWVMTALVSANAVNFIFDYALVFGKWGFPAMGTEGAGWSTAVSRIYMGGFLAVVVLVHLKGLAVSWRPDLKRIRSLLALGAPAAGQIGVEVGVFTLVTAMVGRLGAVTLAGHQIALTTVSTTYMLPLGISSAAAVSVGQAVGRGDRAGASRAGWSALKLGGGVMGLAAIVLVLIPEWIARIFTPDPEVIAATSTLLRIAAFFQLFDGLQTVATGALRGIGDTRTPMVFQFLGYWIIGLPVGAALCFWHDWGAAGLWAGLSLGLILIGIALTWVWHRAELRQVS